MSSNKDYWKLSATEVVDLLYRKEIHPRELIDISISRIAETDGLVNAMVRPCYDRAIRVAES